MPFNLAYALAFALPIILAGAVQLAESLINRR